MSNQKLGHLIFQKLKSLPFPYLVVLIATGTFFSCFFFVAVFSKTDLEQVIKVEEKNNNNSIEKETKKEKEPNPKIVCNKFNLVTNLKGTTLELSVETDLPDYAVVMVSVSRTYLEKNNPEKYLVEYFSERSTIGKWKSKYQISVDGKKWISTLKARQKKLAKIGLGFDIASISENFQVRMVVPINQPNNNFEQGNQNLSGKAVKTDGLRVVMDNIEISHPLNDPPVGKSPFPNLINPQKLKDGQTYVLSKQTPLMPTYDPVDPIAAIKKMKYIPPGARIKVLDLVTKKNHLWYHVDVYNPKKVGTGWINSTALWYNASIY